VERRAEVLEEGAHRSTDALSPGAREVG